MWPLLASWLAVSRCQPHRRWLKYRCGQDRWLTLNNRHQSTGPRPDSRPCPEGARYKYLTNCSRLLSPTSPFSHAHTRTHHQPNSSPAGLAQWACYKKAWAYGSRVGWTPAWRNNNNIHSHYTGQSVLNIHIAVKTVSLTKAVEFTNKILLANNVCWQKNICFFI